MQDDWVTMQDDWVTMQGDWVTMQDDQFWLYEYITNAFQRPV
jgi:hypothetical protein